MASLIFQSRFSASQELWTKAPSAALMMIFQAYSSVPCSPPVRAHGLDFDLNLDKLTRQSGSVRDTNMDGAAGGAASSSGL
jgi:hypothetical protein